MNFKRGSALEDRCFYCRDFCGKPHPRDGEVIRGHSRVAHWTAMAGTLLNDAMKLRAVLGELLTHVHFDPQPANCDKDKMPEGAPPTLLSMLGEARVTRRQNLLVPQSSMGCPDARRRLGRSAVQTKRPRTHLLDLPKVRRQRRAGCVFGGEECVMKIWRAVERSIAAWLWRLARSLNRWTGRTEQ